MRFYRDVLGLPVIEEWGQLAGSGAILDAGRATLELLSVDQSDLVNRVKVGERWLGTDPARARGRGFGGDRVGAASRAAPSGSPARGDAWGAQERAAARARRGCS